MARTVASLPAGNRIADYIGLGVVAKFFPREKVAAVLEQTGRASVRERDLPAHVVVYYVIAVALCIRSSGRRHTRAQDFVPALARMRVWTSIRSHRVIRVEWTNCQPRRSKC